MNSTIEVTVQIQGLSGPLYLMRNIFSSSGIDQKMGSIIFDVDIDGVKYTLITNKLIIVDELFVGKTIKIRAWFADIKTPKQPITFSREIADRIKNIMIQNGWAAMSEF